MNTLDFNSSGVETNVKDKCYKLTKAECKETKLIYIFVFINNSTHLHHF